MSKEKLVIWGASGTALVVSDIIQLRNEYQLVGFIDDINTNRHKSNFGGLTILGGREQLDILAKQGVEKIIIGFGDNEARLRLAGLVSEKGFSLISAIHPSAVIASDVPIGSGTIIAAGAVVNPGSRIGSNVIINTRAGVDHDCIIEDGVHIAPGANIAGSVVVERASWVGIGATVSDHLRIGAGAIIGAGAVVLNDIPKGSVAYGVPAKPAPSGRTI